MKLPVKTENGEKYVTAATVEEFHAALNRGLAVEPSRELADELGLMEDDTISAAEAYAAADDPHD